MLVIAGHTHFSAHRERRQRHATLELLIVDIARPEPEDDVPACECGTVLRDWVWEHDLGDGIIEYIDPICSVCFERKVTAQLPKGV